LIKEYYMSIFSIIVLGPILGWIMMLLTESATATLLTMIALPLTAGLIDGLNQ